jgi:hypothetical protein
MSHKKLDVSIGWTDCAKVVIKLDGHDYVHTPDEAEEIAGALRRSIDQARALEAALKKRAGEIA